MLIGLDYAGKKGTEAQFSSSVDVKTEQVQEGSIQGSPGCREQRPLYMEKPVCGLLQGGREAQLSLRPEQAPGGQG